MRLLWVALVLLSSSCHAARILGMFGVAGKSHTIMFQTLTTELARRGHDLTVITPFPVKDPPPGNYRQIDAVPVREILHQLDTLSISNTNMISRTFKVVDMLGDLCPQILNMPEVKELKNEKFDLVFVTAFFGDCSIPFAWYNKAPLILISPLGLVSWTAENIGNPEPLAYVPSMFLALSEHMSFSERAMNVVYYYVMKGMRAMLMMPGMTAAARDFFGEDVPSLNALESNASVVFINNHVSINYPRPLLPNVIEVGGMHVKATSESLPQDLSEFMESTNEGVIYFSMGSVVKLEQFPNTTVEAMMAAFSELPQRVVMKWNLDSLPGQPENVKISKWLPQQAVLGHPNVKLFVTHGGLLSTQEAVYYGVPLVGIPVMADQQLNMQRSKLLGVAETVDLHAFTTNNFVAAINKVLHTSSYKEAALTLMSRVRDQPESPLERAVFWTEYVLRHDGAPHLRSAASHLAWYQLYLLDVIAAILVFLLLTAFITYKCATALCTSKIKEKQPSARRNKKKQ